MMATPSDRGAEQLDEQLLRQSVLRLNSHVLGFVTGVIAALIIFVATNWLVLKGGKTVGPHLALLGQYFLGYRVTFLGSFIGAVYAFVCGYVAGALVGWIYNRVVLFKGR
jgi:hypothetical protein